MAKSSIETSILRIGSRGSPLALAQIAYECGFADQSHFTRVFTAAVGATPGAWRRARRA